MGLDGVRSQIVMMCTPDGSGRLELTRYETPAAVSADPPSPSPNTLGLHRVMFAVDDIDDTIARLRPHGAQVLGGCAVRGIIPAVLPARSGGIIVALAEQIG